MQKSAILDCRYFAEPLTFTRKFAEAVEDSKGLQHLIFVPNFAADFTTQTAKKDEKIVSILAMTIFAANLIFINGEPSNQSDKGIQPDKQVIIKKRKKIDDQFHRRYFPSKEIMGYVSFGRKFPYDKSSVRR